MGTIHSWRQANRDDDARERRERGRRAFPELTPALAANLGAYGFTRASIRVATDAELLCVHGVGPRALHRIRRYYGPSRERPARIARIARMVCRTLTD